MRCAASVSAFWCHAPRLSLVAGYCNGCQCRTPHFSQIDIPQKRRSITGWTYRSGITSVKLAGASCSATFMNHVKTGLREHSWYTWTKWPAMTSSISDNNDVHHRFRITDKFCPQHSCMDRLSNPQYSNKDGRSPINEKKLLSAIFDELPCLKTWPIYPFDLVIRGRIPWANSAIHQFRYPPNSVIENVHHSAKCTCKSWIIPHIREQSYTSRHSINHWQSHTHTQAQIQTHAYTLTHTQLPTVFIRATNQWRWIRQTKSLTEVYSK